MRACMHVWKRIQHLCIYVCVHACMYGNEYNIYVYMYACMHACMHACMETNTTSMYICMRACMHVWKRIQHLCIRRFALIGAIVREAFCKRPVFIRKPQVLINKREVFTYLFLNITTSINQPWVT